MLTTCNRLLLLPLTLCLAACSYEPSFLQDPEPRPAPAHAAHAAQEVTRAIAVVVPIGDSGVEGVVHFEKSGEAIRVHGRLTGLTPGEHGFHVHEFGDLSDREAGKSAGGHFDPHGEPHGRRTDEKRHVGDLGNVEAGEDGTATFDITDPMIAFEGPNSILGRAVVVHADADVYAQPSGDAGDRVGFGVVGVADPEASAGK